MKGPFRRISSRRQPADPSPQEQQPTVVAPPVQAQPEPTAPLPAGLAPAEPAAAPLPAGLAPAEPAAAPLPAGLAPEDVAPSRPSFRDRGRLRRRLRYLRRVRELGFRDLGGLAFDLHRFVRRNDELVLGKLAALDAVDRELRAIERVLDERRDIIELREPGVAACPRCGALHGSDARFCPQCGIAFRGPLAMVEVGGMAQPAPEAAPIATQGAGEVSPAEEPAATPVTGVLEGNPPPEAPPEPEPSAEPEPATAVAAATTPGDDVPGAGETAGGPGEVVEAEAPAEQPTQAFSSLGGEANGASIASGDPLAPREHPDR
jgi:hypothetical protein